MHPWGSRSAATNRSCSSMRLTNCSRRHSCSIQANARRGLTPERRLPGTTGRAAPRGTARSAPQYPEHPARGLQSATGSPTSATPAPCAVTSDFAALMRGCSPFATLMAASSYFRAFSAATLVGSPRSSAVVAGDDPQRPSECLLIGRPATLKSTPRRWLRPPRVPRPTPRHVDHGERLSVVGPGLRKDHRRSEISELLRARTATLGW